MRSLLINAACAQPPDLRCLCAAECSPALLQPSVVSPVHSWYHATGSCLRARRIRLCAKETPGMLYDASVRPARRSRAGCSLSLTSLTMHQVPEPATRAALQRLPASNGIRLWAPAPWAPAPGRQSCPQPRHASRGRHNLTVHFLNRVGHLAPCMLTCLACRCLCARLALSKSGCHRAHS